MNGGDEISWDFYVDHEKRVRVQVQMLETTLTAKLEASQIGPSLLKKTNVLPFGYLTSSGTLPIYRIGIYR